MPAADTLGLQNAERGIGLFVLRIGRFNLTLVRSIRVETDEEFSTDGEECEEEY